MPDDRFPAPAGLRRADGVAPAGGLLHVWILARDPVLPARLEVAVGSRPLPPVTATATGEFAFAEVPLGTGGPLALAFDPQTTRVSVAYVFDPARVLDEGVAVLVTVPENAPPVPAGYHFRPPFGWMNDPNGFGRHAGRCHLFYQHYPHGLSWNTMHWGHAVSDDLVRWRHLPVFLRPDPDRFPLPDGRGGVFSGSSIPAADGGIRVFFTERLNGRTDPEEEFQWTAVSRDGVTADAPVPALTRRPDLPGLTNDFRDPFVTMGPDSRWKMLLGSRDRQGGLVLLFETEDPAAAADWRFVSVLRREARYRTTVCECPCLLPLPDGRFVLIYALLSSRDPANGRRNLSVAVVGRFDGAAFVPDFEQELDFGTDAYAFQGTVENGEPVLIAWLANWTDVRKGVDHPTAMTLPRRLIVEGDTIRTPPVAAVEGLRRALLDDRRLAAGEGVDLGTGEAEIAIELRPDAAFELRLDHPEDRLAIRVDAEGLAILHRPGTRPAPAADEDTAPTAPGRPHPHYLAAGARPTRLSVFIDRGSIEVFADDGRWVGTRRIAGLAPIHRAQVVEGVEAVAAATVHALGL